MVMDTEESHHGHHSRIHICILQRKRIYSNIQLYWANVGSPEDWICIFMKYRYIFTVKYGKNERIHHNYTNC
jgi:hypothetical protein